MKCDIISDFFPQRFYNVVGEPPVGKGGDFRIRVAVRSEEHDINNPKFSFVKVGSDNHFELFIWWHYTLRWDKLNMKSV